MALRIIFMGTPDFAVPALKALIESDHDVVAVYSQPPRPANRGMSLKKSPVHETAEANGIPVFTPVNFKKADDVETFQNHKADIAVVAAYGLILPQVILDAPKHGCINIHGSLLPKFRGASPIQQTILQGEAVSGNTIIQMAKAMDAGPIISAHPFDLAPQETTGSLHDKLSQQAGEIIVAAVEGFVKNGKATPQDESKVSFAPKIQKADAKIDWSKAANEIDRHVRGYFPYPGAFFEFGGKRIRILAGQIAERSGSPGTVLDDALLVACGEGAYLITKVQMEGKKPMATADFLRGFQIKKGDRVS